MSFAVAAVICSLFSASGATTFEATTCGVNGAHMATREDATELFDIDVGCSMMLLQHDVRQIPAREYKLSRQGRTGAAPGPHRGHTKAAPGPRQTHAAPGPRQARTRAVPGSQRGRAGGAPKARQGQAAQRKIGKLKQRPRYVFAVSTGHVGTTSLSDKESYTGTALSNISFRFENIGGDWEGSEEAQAWREWWDDRPSRDQQYERASTTYLELVEEVLAEKGTHTYVDLGHHIVDGVLRVIPDVFADFLLVRVRRSRYRTASSFFTNHRDLCENLYRVCPLKNPALLQPRNGRWTEGQWSSLNHFQQALWFIDEVEAEWQRLLQKHPRMSYVECTWDDDLSPCLDVVADMLGVDVKNAGVWSKNHTWGEVPLQREEMQRYDEEYKAFMRYDRQTQAMIAGVQPAYFGE
mmetsp:Transcript_14221/g.26429  ORF Transcript_14221/g.26429 Transcript_14221/m.26429 type:complete len:409 (-) Transcript_14221:58-1284(-)